MMLRWLRRYGFAIFVLPMIVSWIDDIATNHHHGGLDTYRQIICENLIEDGLLFFAYFSWMWWRSRPIEMLHLICYRCAHRWAMPSKAKMPNCPRCGASEPA